MAMSRSGLQPKYMRETDEIMLSIHIAAAYEQIIATYETADPLQLTRFWELAPFFGVQAHDVIAM